MQKQLIILSTALVLLSAGCEQKKTTQAEAENGGIKAGTTSAQQKVDKDLGKADKANTPKVESREKQIMLKGNETTEQSLADISRHAREVTQSQESKTRTRAQTAEEEMLKDLEKLK